MYGRPVPYARYTTFHGPKQRVLGNQAGHVPPAWKVPPGMGPAAANTTRASVVMGSKILLSQLPTDVGEREVEELFKKTVGPLKDSFIIYNNAGQSKGMAVVWFQRPNDAAVAKQKYDGKFVDGRRPIKIEIVTDGTSPPTPAPQQPPSLFERIDGRKSATAPGTSTAAPSSTANGHSNHNLPRQAAAAAKIVANSNSFTSTQAPVPPRRRVRKGPKRLKKHIQKHKTAEELDREMEDYRAAAEST
ncbi:hypothetical protein VNI00_012383 [Paramarasmius palmivorus]|uniref:RRM domain-containing protein n=1 Tax=Paramarasmius palmivorus TaxID=297713 RepID=A0AAW0C5B6_9AGAR